MESMRVENLGKQYKLGITGTGTLSHDLNRFFARIRGKTDPYAKIGEKNDRTSTKRDGYVWALENVSFSVNQGDVLGVIGRNGAGKSTLLKLLSKITTPSTGDIRYKGKLASLLEVGTGFHPELTGLENIFLNGAILGMSKLEIKSKLDQIIDFSGCSAFIDTPVKRYSSGMMVRLGFSVAAHLEPDILIVDEVLAVGDVEFQQKCLGKMNEVSKAGRTILFVSHNMQAVSKLCNKGLYLKDGQMVSTGGIEDVITDYSGDLGAKDGYYSQLNPEDLISEGFIKSVVVTNSVTKEKKIALGDNWYVDIEVELIKDTRHVIVAFGVLGMMDEIINTTWSSERDLKKGNYVFRFHSEKMIYAGGNYSLSAGLSTFERSIEYLPNITNISIEGTDGTKINPRILRTKGTGFILNPMREEFFKR